MGERFQTQNDNMYRKMKTLENENCICAVLTPRLTVEINFENMTVFWFLSHQRNVKNPYSLAG